MFPSCVTDAPSPCLRFSALQSPLPMARDTGPVWEHVSWSLNVVCSKGTTHPHVKRLSTNWTSTRWGQEAHCPLPWVQHPWLPASRAAPGHPSHSHQLGPARPPPFPLARGVFIFLLSHQVCCTLSLQNNRLHEGAAVLLMPLWAEPHFVYEVLTKTTRNDFFKRCKGQ